MSRNLAEPGGGAGPSLRQAALTAGLASLAMVVLAFFANFLVVESLVEPGDAAATFSNIAGDTGLWRGAIAAFVGVFALDVVMAWALYVFLRPVNRSLSLLAAFFRLAVAAISATAVLHLAAVLPLVDGDGYAAVLEPGVRAAQAMLSVDSFQSGWAIALAFFGVYLLLLGYLAYRAEHVPSVLGVLLALAGVGYLADTLARILLPAYGDVEAALTLVTVVAAVAGEFTWMFWLLLRGGRDRRRPGDVMRPDESAPRVGSTR